ncbi:uncharacterized protein METZ01_LOCUS396678, partial [marine metagenome]
MTSKFDYKSIEYKTKPPSENGGLFRASWC